MIPPDLYLPIFNNLVLLLLIVTIFIYSGIENRHFNTRRFSSFKFTLFIAVLFALFIGFRPVDPVFGDAPVFARQFLRLKGLSFDQLTEMVVEDHLFVFFSFFLSENVDLDGYFFVIALIYLLLPLITIKRIFPNNIWVTYLMYISAFSFFSYSTNGVRSGLATAFFILSLGYITSQRILSLLLILISVGFHNSMILPSAALLLSYFYNNTRFYMTIWFIAIPISLILGDGFSNYIAETWSDGRMSLYLTKEYDSFFSRTGFRWDFLLYSSVPIIIGYYIIYIKKYKSEFYSLLLNTYLIANAFWVLVINVSFSNRFAYLSWLLYPIVTIYPFLNFKLSNKQYRLVLIVLFLHFSFTYFMFIIK